MEKISLRDWAVNHGGTVGGVKVSDFVRGRGFRFPSAVRPLRTSAELHRIRTDSSPRGANKLMLLYRLLSLPCLNFDKESTERDHPNSEVWESRKIVLF